MFYRFNDGGNEYAQGNASYSGVHEIHIDWIAGAVNVVSAAVDEVRVEEENLHGSGLDMCSFLNADGVLDIRFAKNGSKLFNRFRLAKTLTVTIPKDIKLSALLCTAVAASITCSDFECGNLGLASTSGGICAQNAKSSYCTVKNVAGASCASGSFGVFTASSVSGAVKFDGYVDKCSIKSVSSGISARFGSQPSSIDAKSTSGGIKLKFDSPPDMTVSVKSISGKFSSSLPCTQSKDCCVYASGAAAVTLKTISGGISIE